MYIVQDILVYEGLDLVVQVGLMYRIYSCMRDWISWCRWDLCTGCSNICALYIVQYIVL